MAISKPFDAVLESGLIEIIGKDDAEVANGEYSKTADVALEAVNGHSGEILSITLVSTMTGTGAIQVPACKLMFLDADPDTTSGDAALSAAESKTIIGYVDIAAADWITDTNASVAHKAVSVPFHSITTMYAVLKSADAAAINSAEADDEIIEFNLWYRRDS